VKLVVNLWGVQNCQIVGLVVKLVVLVVDACGFFGMLWPACGFVGLFLFVYLRGVENCGFVVLLILFSWKVAYNFHFH
jgi:hypothetical protein